MIIVNSNPIGADATVPYVVSYNTWFRAFAVVYAALAFCLLVLAHDNEGRPVAVAVWNRHGWLVRIGLALGFVTIPGILSEMFLEKIVFGVGQIRRRNVFGRWQEYIYDDASALEVFPGELARIRFRDGRKLTVRAAMADLNRVEALLNLERPYSLTNCNLVKDDSDLPFGAQQDAKRAYRLFQSNPAHPGLQFKKLEGQDNIYSVRIGLEYRALAVMKKDRTVWYWIGSHSRIRPSVLNCSAFFRVVGLPDLELSAVCKVP